jgi:hypothetical protein
MPSIWPARGGASQMCHSCERRYPGNAQSPVRMPHSGVYGSNTTYHLDFSTLGSYGRGSYAGSNTYDVDFNTSGSYGRGIYAGHSTYDLDWLVCDNYARGMTELRSETHQGQMFPMRRRAAERTEDIR